MICSFSNLESNPGLFSVLESNTTTCREFTNLCNLLGLDPNVSKTKQPPKAEGEVVLLFSLAFFLLQNFSYSMIVSSTLHSLIIRPTATAGGAVAEWSKVLL